MLFIPLSGIKDSSPVEKNEIENAMWKIHSQEFSYKKIDTGQYFCASLFQTQ